MNIKNFLYYSEHCYEKKLANNLQYMTYHTNNMSYCDTAACWDFECSLWESNIIFYQSSRPSFFLQKYM